MSKAALKRSIAIEQGGFDDYGATLSPAQSLNDTDRKRQKKDGGTYAVRKNVRVLDPVNHMGHHNILRIRDTTLEQLKSIFDDRVQVMKLELKIQNQLRAYERRTDIAHPETAAFLTEQLKPIHARLAAIDKQLANAVKTYHDPLAQAALAVKGLGPVTVAALSVYVDLAKRICVTCRRAPGDGQWSCKCSGEAGLVDAAATPSALWKYVGLDKPSHERYTKGEAGGGNKTLRTVLYNTACTLMKMNGSHVSEETHPEKASQLAEETQSSEASHEAEETQCPSASQRPEETQCVVARFRSPYRDVYDRVKDRLAVSEKVVKTRNTQGKLVESAWKDAKPSHRHGAALRAVIKHLLADYWLVGRTLAGLSTAPLYVESMLGHTHIVSPRERGWTF